MANETPSRPPPPLMANAILNFHFDFLNPSLIVLPLGCQFKPVFHNKLHTDKIFIYKMHPRREAPSLSYLFLLT